MNRLSIFRAWYDKTMSRFRVLVGRPSYCGTLLKRGKALMSLKRFNEALVSYDRALAIAPGCLDAFFNRGVALALLGRYEQALESFERVLEGNPDHAVAHFNRGVVLDDLMRYEDALASYDRALKIKPNYADALNNRGGLFRQFGFHERSALDYARLVRLDPGYADALGNALFSDMQICNWNQFSIAKERISMAVRAGKRASLPFQMTVISDSAADQLACAKIYAAQQHPSSGMPLWSGERYQHKRIRLAYLSADFQHHATAYLMAELFEKHDRNKFAMSAWSFGPHVEDDMRARLRNAFEQFKEVRVNSDFEIATMLRTQEIDIAIDLKGFTQYSRPGIFAHRAAPIQVNYLGYPGTMGAAYIDYIIGDAVVTPFEHEAFYDEKVVRLPDTYQVNDTKRVIAERTPSRSEVHLPESGFVFCCFNNNFKITPDFFDIWMRLLKRVEGSVLWLREDNAAASRNLKMAAEARGVRAERLVFATHMPLPDHLARHRAANLFLDTLPYNAHTTTSDALWAGLPVLTCMGSAFQGRVAASLLRATGLPELVTDNLADYEALAFKLASTPTMLNEIKTKLARNRATHPLFDIDRFTRHIESAYTSMYERHLRGEKPQSFSVKPLPLTRIR